MTLDQIRTKARFLTSTDSGTFPDTQLVVEANNALDRVVSLIEASDGRWQWDDENNTDLPIATTALVSAQQDYTLSITHLQIIRVEVQDTSSSWHKLQPIDSADLYQTALTDYQSGNGLPVYYDKTGNSIFLYPAPNYSQSASLKVFFKRGPSYFTTGDTTKSPGFNSLYHELIPLWIAYNFALANGKTNASMIFQQITVKEEMLKADYASRAKDEHTSLQARPANWR